MVRAAMKSGRLAVMGGGWSAGTLGEMKQMLILLQRMALLLLLFFSLPATGFAQNVEIEVGDPGGQDDYICWSPAPARIRLKDTLPTAVEVALRSTYTGGAVVFNPKPAHLAVSEKTRTMSMSAKDFASPAPTKELMLKLPGDRSWVYFFMSGALLFGKGQERARARRPQAQLVMFETVGVALRFEYIAFLEMGALMLDLIKCGSSKLGDPGRHEVGSASLPARPAACKARDIAGLWRRLGSTTWHCAAGSIPTTTQFWSWYSVFYPLGCSQT